MASPERKTCRQCKRRRRASAYTLSPKLSTTEHGLCDDCYREKTRANNLKYRYGVTVEWYDAMFETQGGVCVICSKPPEEATTRGGARLAVDHDAVTGEPIALACASCNLAIGHFNHDPEILASALAYVGGRYVRRLKAA